MGKDEWSSHKEATASRKEQRCGIHELSRMMQSSLKVDPPPDVTQAMILDPSSSGLSGHHTVGIRQPAETSPQPSKGCWGLYTFPSQLTSTMNILWFSCKCNRPTAAPTYVLTWSTHFLQSFYWWPRLVWALLSHFPPSSPLKSWHQLYSELWGRGEDRDEPERWDPTHEMKRRPETQHGPVLKEQMFPLAR